MRAKIVPDVVEARPPLALPSAASVRQAATMMADNRVAAVLVIDDGELVGIFTERDVTVRVVAAGLPPDTTLLQRVMTPEPATLAADDSVGQALEAMRRMKVRHLPVIGEDGTVVAVVSVRDLLVALQKELETEVLSRDAHIFGLSDAWTPSEHDI
ncbi:MAG: CBS domain-containing protein [Actinomycetota bacterium]